MSTRARRLFNLDGIEIICSDDIQREVEYCVSSGEDFRLPEVRTAVSSPVFRERTPRDKETSSYLESQRMDLNRTPRERRDFFQKVTSDTESITYVYFSSYVHE